MNPKAHKVTVASDNTRVSKPQKMHKKKKSKPSFKVGDTYGGVKITKSLYDWTQMKMDKHFNEPRKKEIADQLKKQLESTKPMMTKTIRKK